MDIHYLMCGFFIICLEYLLFDDDDDDDVHIHSH